MISQILSHAESALAAGTADDASLAFMAAARPYGASYLQTRVYRRPLGRLTSASHWNAGGVVARIAPHSWPGSPGFDYVCFECNPLLAPIREGRTRYSFGGQAPHHKRQFGAYWEALSEAGIAEACCATAYGEAGAIASLHLGFATREAASEHGEALQLAGLLLAERLMSLVELPAPTRSALTPRERDTLALVAEGKTDWEISVIIGISEATARFHVDNGRRKLGAVNRAQAVARLIEQRLL